MLYRWWLCAIHVICHLSRDGYKILHFFVKACWYRYHLEYWSQGSVIGDGSLFHVDWRLESVCLGWVFLMMITLLIHTWLNSIAKQSSLSRGTCFDHIWSKSAVWQSPPTRGICLDHIWSKFTVRQSLPMRGTFWTTFGQIPLRDKVLQQGAQFWPHLVKVCCVPKYSNEGHNLGHIWSKSAAWQSCPMRGTICTIFGRSLQWDKVLQWGASFFCHIWQLSAAWQLCLMTNHGYHSLATFDQSQLCDTFSNEGHCFPFYARFGQCQLLDMQLSSVIVQIFECL